MATKALPQMKQWSFSRLKDYRKCPFLAKCKHIDKLKEPPNKAMDRGTAIHKMAEKAAFEKPKAELPEDLQLFEQEFNMVRKLPAQAKQVELKLAFNIQWQLLPDFFDRNTWSRVVYDLRFLPEPKKLERVSVIDHKTGKMYDDNEEQLDLYALSEFSANAATLEVSTELWYIDAGEVKDKLHKRKDVPKMIKYWDKETKAMLADRRFDPNPGNYCTYCHFRKSNGGPCAY